MRKGIGQCLGRFSGRAPALALDFPHPPLAMRALVESSPLSRARLRTDRWRSPQGKGDRGKYALRKPPEARARACIRYLPPSRTHTSPSEPGRLVPSDSSDGHG